MSVEEDERHRPASLTLRGRRFKVASIEDTWEIADEWWRPKPVHRAYYAAITEDGATVTIFRDLVGGGWYRQRCESRVIPFLGDHAINGPVRPELVEGWLWQYTAPSNGFGISWN